MVVVVDSCGGGSGDMAAIVVVGEDVLVGVLLAMVELIGSRG